MPEYSFAADGTPLHKRLSQYSSLVMFKNIHEIIWPDGAPSKLKLSLNKENYFYMSDYSEEWINVYWPLNSGNPT